MNFEKRGGKITASRALDFMTSGRAKADIFGETAKTYARQLALERLGYEIDDIDTWQMEWGKEWEGPAGKIYVDNNPDKICKPNAEFMPYLAFPDIAGCTPDIMVFEDETEEIIEGLVEIKCPQWAAYSKYYLEGPTAERRYIYQMQFQMMCTGAQWCDFLIFHPHMPTGMKAKVFRVEADDVLITDMHNRLEPFNMLVENYVSEFKGFPLAK